MPKITAYETRTRGMGPVETRRLRPGDFAAQGQAMSGFGEALGEVGDLIQKRAEQTEVSDLAAKMAQTQSDMTIGLQEQLRTAEPGDTTIAQNFLEKFDERMGQMSEGISTGAGRNYFKQTSASMRGHFATGAVAGQVDLAGVKARQDYEVSINALSSSTLTDPSAFEHAREMHKNHLGNLVATGGLPTKAAAELLTHGDAQIAKSAVRGWIKLNPKEAEKQLKGGQWDAYFMGEEKAQLFGEVDQEIRGRELEAEHRRKEFERVQKEAQQKVQNEFLGKLNQGQLAPKDILDSDLEAFGSGSKDQFLRMLQSEDTSPLKKTDPSLYIKLWDRVHLPDGDPEKITDDNMLNEYAGRGLKVSDIIQLRQEIAGRKTQEGVAEADMKAQLFSFARARLVKPDAFGLTDPIGEENFLRFKDYFYTEYAAGRAKGKSHRELLSPDSPDYVGKGLNMYVRTPEQIINEMANRIRKPTKAQAPETAPAGAAPTPTPAPGVAARKPGETPRQYLERMKAGK